MRCTGVEHTYIYTYIFLYIIYFLFLPGFRYRSRPLYTGENYLPSPCVALSVKEINQVKEDLCNLIIVFFNVLCNIEDVFILCG